jgi:hypothetical protein
VDGGEDGVQGNHNNVHGHNPVAQQGWWVCLCSSLVLQACITSVQYRHASLVYLDVSAETSAACNQAGAESFLNTHECLECMASLKVAIMA